MKVDENEVMSFAKLALCFLFQPKAKEKVLYL